MELTEAHSLMDQVMGATTPRNNGTHPSAEKSAERKRISLGERMAQLGLFSDKERSPPVHAKTLPNPVRANSPVSNPIQASITPGNPENVVGVTQEIRQFFDSLEKVPAPKGFSIETWEREPSVRPPRDAAYVDMYLENRDPNMIVDSYRQNLELQNKISSSQSYQSNKMPLQSIENINGMSAKDLQGPQEYMRGSQTIFGHKESSRNSSFVQEPRSEGGNLSNLSVRGSVTSQNQDYNQEFKERTPFADIGNYNDALNVSQSKGEQQYGLQPQYFEKPQSRPLSIHSRMSSASVFDFGKAYDFGYAQEQPSPHDVILFDESRVADVHTEQYKAPVEDVEGIKNRNAFLESEVARYQAEVQMRSTREEELNRENGILRGELEKYKLELQNRLSNEEIFMKENTFLRNKILSYENRLEGINTGINQLATENERLNQELTARTQELDTYRATVSTPFDNPFDTPVANYGGEFPRYSEKVRPSSPLHSEHSRNNMSMDMAYLGGFAPTNVNYFSGDVNGNNTPKRRIFEEVNYEMPRMVVNPADFATV